MIANNARKQQNLFVQGYNLEVINYITCKSGASQALCDVKAIITFGEIHTLLKEYRRTRKGMKDKRNRHGAVGKSSLEQHFRKSAIITFIV